jgi:lysophospholipase L1-like esterase
MKACRGAQVLVGSLLLLACSSPGAHEATAGGAAGATPMAGAGTSGVLGGAGGHLPNGGAPAAGAAGAPLGGRTSGGSGGRAAGSGGGAGSDGTAGAALGGAGSSGAMSDGGRAGRSGSSGSGLGGAAPGGAGPGGRASGGSAAGGSAGAGALPPVTVYLAGDSTVQSYADTPSTTDQAGWGQMLGALFDAKVTVENRAIGGRTARRFVDEGSLDAIFEDLAAGDYLLVQFGTNDGNKTATYELAGETIPYYLDPATDFKTYLELYIDGARERSAVPVLVTPPPRNSAYCTGGNGTGAHAEAMRELGAAEDVAVLDLNRESVDYLTAICPAPTPEDFFLLRSDGSVDGTHFQENGARILAGLVATEMQRVALPLAAYLE